ATKHITQVSLLFYMNGYDLVCGKANHGFFTKTMPQAHNSVTVKPVSFKHGNTNSIHPISPHAISFHSAWSRQRWKELDLRL
ncbi:hypothetical protein AVEN_145868-1, partial [Araneus ventricosus]